MSHDVPIGATQVSLAQLSERSREIFRQLVESYLATGEPVGSRNLARILPMTLSPASVRNIMQRWKGRLLRSVFLRFWKRHYQRG